MKKLVVTFFLGLSECDPLSTWLEASVFLGERGKVTVVSRRNARESCSVFDIRNWVLCGKPDLSWEDFLHYFISSVSISGAWEPRYLEMSPCGHVSLCLRDVRLVALGQENAVIVAFKRVSS